MFAAHTGTEVVATTLSNAGPRVAASVTRDEQKHKLFIKVVNGTSDTQRIQLDVEGASSVKRQANLVTMSAKSPNATNTITRPENIKPVERTIQVASPKFEYGFLPYSVNVIELSY
jgi:alpha-L-arabinofuranosidase